MPKASDKQMQSSQRLAKLLKMNDSNQISTAELRHNSAQIVSRVAVGGERIVVTKNRKPVAAIVPLDDYNSLDKRGKRRS